MNTFGFELEFCKTSCPKTNPMRCCFGCSSSKNGYFRNKEDFDVANTYHKFDKKVGFWTENGCALPRNLRPEICVSHLCYDHAAAEAYTIKFHKKYNWGDYSVGDSEMLVPGRCRYSNCVKYQQENENT